MLGREPTSRPLEGTQLPPEAEISTPGAVLVVDDRGRLRDRSPRASNDPVLSSLELSTEVPRALIESADARHLVHEGSTLDALWFSGGDRAPSLGMSERDVDAMLRRMRNLVSVLVASDEAAAMVGEGPMSTRLGSTRRRELDRMVDALAALGHAYAPVGARAFVDLELALRRVIDSARAGARDRGVQLRLSGAREARRGRTGDEALLQAAVHALVSNAIDASPSGGEVHVRVEASKAAVSVVVEDEGTGLIAPPRGELGAPFSSSKRGGLGLGLTIARRAAFAHGGELRVATRAEGKGTAALLWIPTSAG